MTKQTLSSLDQFRSAGAIVSRQPVEKKIEWTAITPETGDEQEFEAKVYLLKPGAGLMSDMFGNEDRHLMVKAIQKCLRVPVVGGDLTTLTELSYDDVFDFDTPFLSAIWDQLTIMAGLTKKNASPRPMNSTSNSPSPESAATP